MPALRDFFPHAELNSLYLSISLREFAIAMLGVFIPLYLLKLGYSLHTVLIFFAIQFLAHSLLALAAGWFASRYGIRHSLFLSMVFLIAFYAALFSLERQHLNLSLLAVLAGAGNALFWVAYHAYFAHFSRGDGRGKKVGIGDVFRQLKFIGPFVGGALIVLIGFRSLFLLVCVVLLVSCIVVSCFSEELKKRFDPREVFRRRKMRDVLGLLGHGVEGSMGSVIWPIIIFYTILQSYAVLGAVTSVSLVFAVISAYLAGHFADADRRIIMRLAALSQSVVWTLRYFVTTAFQVFAVDAIYGVTNAGVRVPFVALTYDKADGEILNYTIFRETYINFGSFLLMVALTAVPNLHDTIFVGAGVSFFYMLF